MGFAIFLSVRFLLTAKADVGVAKNDTVGLVLIASPNCEFSGVCKLLIRKLILLIVYPYVQFAQTQLFTFTI